MNCFSYVLVGLLALPVILFAGVSSETSDPPAPATGVAYTYGNVTGNRYLPQVSGAFPEVVAADVQLDGVPLWVVGGLVNGTPVWVVALDDGRVVAAQPTPGGGSISAMAIQIGGVAAGAPIAAQFSGDGLPMLLSAPDVSPLTHPVMTDAAGTLVYINLDGELALSRDDETLTRTEGAALQLDGRPALGAGGLVAVYAGATDARYVHGIMGDDIEGAELVVYDTHGDALTEVSRVVLPDDDVFEGIQPMWADMDDDGVQEIVTTVSNGQLGAWLRVYNADGSVLAETRPIGQGFRWRHQIAVGPFGIDGETQLVDVRTPHIGGMPEFFTLAGDVLAVQNAQLGYTSHIINSRNLDMATAGDFDGDGVPELVVTDQPRQNVVGVVNSVAGVQERWRLPLDGALTTNLAAVALPEGGAALAAGTDANMLRVWLPD